MATKVLFHILIYFTKKDEFDNTECATKGNITFLNFFQCWNHGKLDHKYIDGFGLKKYKVCITYHLVLLSW